jgi:4-amino-4-deoxychorismate lyase
VPAESALRDGDAAGFDLIETLRWELGAGFVRLERHLDRLCSSAAALGFGFGRSGVVRALGEAVAGAASPQRVRLLLHQGGDAEAAAHPFEPLPAGKVWRLRIAHARLSSADMLLRHKTTRRETYVQARAEYPAAQADEVLLINERGEACEGTITSLFVDFGDGVLLTPRLDCGLLPGVLRAELLDEGRAVEAVIAADALRSARALFVGNSLRGLISAELT